MAAADAKTDAPKERQPLGSRSGKRGYIRICVRCGRELRGVGGSTKYCPDCRADVNREHARERYRWQKALEREAQKAKSAPPSCTAPSVGEVAALADAAGLTYGQYVARHK